MVGEEDWFIHVGAGVDDMKIPKQKGLPLLRADLYIHLSERCTFRCPYQRCAFLQLQEQP